MQFVKRVEMVAAISALGAHTAVVMLTQVDYRTDERYDMKAITALAQSKGALMLWDLAHSTCVFRVELNACNADITVGALTVRQRRAGGSSVCFRSETAA